MPWFTMQIEVKKNEENSEAGIVNQGMVVFKFIHWALPKIDE